MPGLQGRPARTADDAGRFQFLAGRGSAPVTESLADEVSYQSGDVRFIGNVVGYISCGVRFISYDVSFIFYLVRFKGNVVHFEGNQFSEVGNEVSGMGKCVPDMGNVIRLTEKIMVARWLGQNCRKTGWERPEITIPQAGHCPFPLGWAVIGNFPRTFSGGDVSGR